MVIFWTLSFYFSITLIANPSSNLINFELVHNDTNCSNYCGVDSKSLS